MAPVRSKSRQSPVAEVAPAPLYSEADNSPGAFWREEYTRTHHDQAPGAKPRSFRAEATPTPSAPRHHRSVRLAAAPAPMAEEPGFFHRLFGEAHVGASDSATVSTRRTWNDACESHHGWVHQAVEFFARRIRAIGCSCADVENIIMRMMQRESHGDPHAANGGCYGLLQLNPATMNSVIRENVLHCSRNPYDPHANILCGVGYYVSCLEQTGGSYRTACAAYNWGPYRQAIRAKDEARYPNTTKAYVEAALDLPPNSIARSEHRGYRHHRYSGHVHHHHRHARA